ncbi:MAG: ATP-binding protein [Lachnospiraceae bacterium]|nr:ATP-binding protein [Lachnospiraceae bacterium]
MTFGVENLNQVITKMIKEELKYEDTILIGDNSSGKSELLRRLINELRKSQSVYFIDAVNRNFSVQAVSRTEKVPVYTEYIINTRLNEEHFNIKDSFNCYGTNTERIEIIYNLFETELQNMFSELVGKTFELLSDTKTGQVKFVEGEGLLSSGYQALIRILLELLYCKKTMKETSEKIWIVIDELDEFLSPRYAGKICGFLKKKFSEFRFVVTTHSCDLVANASDANLIVLTQDDFEVWDVNDYDSNSSVQIIFDRVFGIEEQSTDQNFDLLRNLLSKRINGAWSEMEEKQFDAIDVSKLTASQALIHKQIREW